MSHKRLDERIKSLYLQKEKYENHPIFQREQVWSRTMKQSLIDTILRNMYIHPLLVHEKRLETGETRYDVIDGQQRLLAIFEFMDGVFPTMSANQSRKEEPGSLPPVEPRKHYVQLSPQGQNTFNDYTLHLYILEDLDDPIVGLTFRRVQNQVPLTMAEKLWSYTSKTASFAAQVAEHAVWQQWYQGKLNRKQGFQGGLYIIFLELLAGYVNMTLPRLRDLAAGTKDKDLTDEKKQQILDRLDVVLHAFSGTPFTNKEEIIPMYQAVLFLENEGCVFKQSTPGILSPWMARLQAQPERQVLRGIASLFSQLVYTNKQHDFWEAQLPMARNCYQEGLRHVEEALGETA